MKSIFFSNIEHNEFSKNLVPIQEVFIGIDKLEHSDNKLQVGDKHVKEYTNVKSVRTIRDHKEKYKGLGNSL